VTVLFADTPRRVGLEDLELDVRDTTRTYASMREVLEAYGGTVERHAQDAVMAVFGVPVARDDDARRAVAAALELQRLAADLPDGELSVGINTGEVLTGDPASDEELVVGDPVVVAARLQQLAQPGEVLVGPTTRRLLRDVALGERREVVLRGRQGTVTVVPVLGLTEPRVAGPRGPFVGREAERTVLAAALERTVQTGIVQLVTVLGEAGTGKTRLVDEVVRRTKGLFVVRGVCRGYGESSLWPPVDEVSYEEWGPEGATSAMLTVMEGQSPHLTDVQQLMTDMFEGATALSADDLAWAMSRLLSRLSDVAPVVVLLEDLHVASNPLLDLVPAVLARLESGPVVAVVTARPELLDLRRHWGRGLRHVVGLTLRPLPEDAARELLSWHLPGGEGGDAVLAAAGGNPLFLEQLAQARREGLHIGGESSPPTVTAVLAARLDRLPLGARRVLERAAVIGSVGVVTDLPPLLDSAADDLDAHLAVLADRDLLESDAGRWSFGSELVRDAALAGLAREERSELHQRRGLVLGTRGQQAAAGYHLEQASRLLRASDPARSLALAEHAGSRLASAGLRALSGDLAAACDLLERAVALLPADSHRRLSLLTELARGLQLTGDLGRARQILDEVVERCAETGLVDAGAHARLALVDLLRSADPERAYAELPTLLDSVLPVLEAAGDDRGLALARQLQASSLQYRVRWAAMEEPLEKSLHHAYRAGDRRLVELAESLQVGSMFHGPMPLDQARIRLEELLEQPGASPWHRASVQARLGGTVALQGDPTAGRVLVEDARKAFRDLGRELSVLATAFVGGPVELLAGAPERAAHELRIACDGLAAMGDKAFTSTLAALLGEACWRTGDLDGVSRAVDQSRRLAGRGDVISQVRWRAVQAKLDAVRGNAEEALRLSAEAVQMVVGTDEVVSQGDVLADAAEVQLLLGDGTAGRVLLRDALARYERKGAPQAAAVVRARLEPLLSAAGRAGD
jgi:class 3 adenylate cyclase